jgi:DNA-binding XRE family transcriptional regulator
MTPHDLRTWRLRLGLTQHEAAVLLGIGHRTYHRHESGGWVPWVPAWLSAACYGANAAVRAAEQLIESCDWDGKEARAGARYWNLRLTEEEMHYRRVVGLARRLLDLDELSGVQSLHFCGHSLSVMVPRNYCDPSSNTSLARPEKQTHPYPS